MNGLLRKSLYFLLSAVFLVGCGGSGGGGGGTTPTPTPTAKVVTLTVVDAGTNAATTSVSKAKPAKAIAKVTSGGAAVAGEVVTFSADAGFLVVDPSSGTALTNASGEATINVLAGTTKGATTISAGINGGITSNIVGLESAGDGSAGGPNKSVSLQLVDPNTNQPITTIRPDLPGKLIATVTNTSKTELVSFTTTIGELPIKTAATNAQNQASVNLLAGDIPGSGKVTATVDGASAELVFSIGSADVRMGTAEGTFVSGQATIASATLSAGGTNTIKVKLVDSAGNPYLQPVSVNFTTTCAILSKASISSPVTTVNGVATSTYLDKGCATTDNVTVSATTGGVSLSATGSFTVLAASAGSIAYISATPKVIALRGTGGLGRSESSVVVFKVLDKLGNPVNGKSVSFALNTQIGGLSINPVVADTNTEGLVQTTVTSGTVATPVRVTATTAGEAGATITSVSDELVISTGLPDQNSFSLSVSNHTPEGWLIDGVESTVTARLADHFNNPVPDGTAVYFRTEGGAIEPSCITANGVCSVKWRSQNPRPAGQGMPDGPRRPCGSILPSDPKQCAAGRAGYYGQPYGGRSTVTAVAVGEEYFPDTNGNGYFDVNEYRVENDMKEAFVDDNEDGLFNPAEGGDVNDSGRSEEPIDFNNDTLFTGADGKYTGVLCNPAQADKSRCVNEAAGERKSLHVRMSQIIIMSGNPVARFTEGDGVTALSSITFTDKEQTKRVCVYYSDSNNQPIPSGTGVAFSASQGSVQGSPNFTQPDTAANGADLVCVVVKSGDKKGEGDFEVKFSLPSGLIVRWGFSISQTGPAG